ncbi:MAG: thiamine pyrophosphate-binding protein, partial [Fluviibacter sp.]
MANPSVAAYLAQRLSDLGIDRVFGVPGDYAFSFDDAVEECASLKWVACANELNASYAADGYARRFGAAILSTTYGVGELSALNGVMGCYTERVPVFHVVGAPSRRITNQKLITHHTHGDGVFGNFEHLSQSACCVSAFLTPANAISEIERVIHEALKHARPAYIVVPMDSGKVPVIGTPVKGSPISLIKRQIAVSSEVDAAADAVMKALDAAKNPLVLPSMLLQRYGLNDKLAKFLDMSNLPFALTPMDKGLVNENHPGFIGMYKGGASTPPSTQDIVESADLILDLGGVVFEDLNTGLWSSNLSPDRMIKVSDTWVQVGQKVWIDTALSDVLDAL